MKKTGLEQKSWGWVAVLAAIVAVGLHLYLTIEYYHLKLGLAEGKSSCNINQTFNCDAVAASSFANLFGVPMALFGVWTNLLFAVLLTAALLGISDRIRGARLSFLLGAVLLLASVVMGLISATQLGTYCLYCMAAYATSILAFLGAFLWARGEKALKDYVPGLMSQLRATAGWLIAIPLLAFFTHKIMMDQYGAGQMDMMVQEGLNDYQRATVQTFDLQNGLITQNGTAEPKVILVEFMDLLCPHCKVFNPTLHAFVEGHSDVRLVQKIFPLDGACNPDTRMHKGDGLRCQLSRLVLCAEKLAHKGTPAVEHIFEHQAEYYGQGFDLTAKAVADGVQVPLEQLKTCIDDEATASSLLSMADEGVKADIHGTPALYLNGKVVPRAQLMSVLEAVYQAAKK